MSTEGTKALSYGFSVNAGELKAKVERFKHVIPNQPTNKVLGYILLHQIERTLVLSGCDNTKFAFAVLGVEWIGTSIKMAVPYKQFMDFLRGILEEDMLKCAQVERKNRKPCLLVETSYGQHIFPGIHASEYPPYPKCARDCEIILGIDDVMKIFNSASSSEDKLDIFTPRGYVFSLYGRSDLLFSKAKIVPAEALEAFLLSVKGLSSHLPASIWISDDCIHFSYAGFGLDCSLLDSSYLTCKGVISPEPSYTITFEREKLCQALKRLLSSVGEKHPGIVFNFAADNATLLAQKEIHSKPVVEHVACKYEGAPLKISFNGKNLLSILEELYGWHIVMKIASAEAPIIIEPDRHVLPYRKIGLLVPMAERA